MKRLENKSVFITGGLSGIGKECALMAAKEGANIAIADLKSDDSKEVLNEIQKINAKAIFIECDVSDFNQVENAINKVVDTFGSLDVAFNNAGIGGKSAKVGDLEAEDWTQVIDINLNGVFNCCRHELKQMETQKRGVIINMSSILGKVGFATSSHYSAAKHGVIGLTQTAALEYAQDGIRINALCPGFISTPLMDKSGINEDKDTKKLIESKHAMNRMGKSKEIANAFIFLASDESSFATGSAFEIDGGYLAQ